MLPCAAEQVSTPKVVDITASDGTVLKATYYERLKSGDTETAVEIFHLNVVAYPDSANVYDSLGDAYLADGQKELALQNAKRALELLSKNTSGDEGERNAIRESAEQKVKQLTAAN